MSDYKAYDPPKASTDMPPPGDQVAACPKCKNTTGTKVRFTWWGGALGPRLFSVVQCGRCATRFNGKTGGSLTTVIIVYQAVILGIALLLFGAYYATRR